MAATPSLRASDRSRGVAPSRGARITAVTPLARKAKVITMSTTSLAPIELQPDRAVATPISSNMGRAITEMPPIQTAGDGPLAEGAGGGLLTTPLWSRAAVESVSGRYQYRPHFAGIKRAVWTRLELTNQDPAVRASKFRIEAYPWTLPAGLMTFAPGHLPRSMAEV
jgi:hypothetical protein